MNVKPLYDRVLVKRDKEETRTASGLFIPNSATEKPIFGTVKSVGQGKLLQDGNLKSLLVKVEDRIIFSKYSGVEIKVNGEELLVLKEEDIIAIVEN